MENLERLVEPLLRWYDGQRRILPWREEPTPYRVWVSEIMLQQTRVEAVKPYFERFLHKLPDVQSLAEVEEDDLLKLWEGLGYYNRARNLKKAAQTIVAKYHGVIPDDMNQLLELSGIGSYTAGAISSIAYQKPNPAVDGNVLRIISRVLADEGDILSTHVKKQLEESLFLIMPKDRPGDFNQALMELGAMVCIPNGMAKCDECPWNSFCEARIQDRVLELPYKSKKKPRVIEDKTILVIQDENRSIIRKRPGKGLLAGLYEFPTMEGHHNMNQVVAYVKELGFRPIRVNELEKSKHIFSHREWHMIGYAIRVDEIDRTENTNNSNGFLLVEKKETEDRYPIPTAFLAYTKYLNIKLGNDKFSVEDLK